MHTETITWRSSQIHYALSGRGAQILLCLHGYGENERSFHFLEKYLPAGYTLLAIDFPYHGQTLWKDGPSFTISYLLEIIRAIRVKHAINSNRFTLLAFSMGGRIALQLLQQMPEQIDKVVLLAPDGLKVNFWYWLSTQTIIGNRLFSFTMHHPQWFFWLLAISNKLKLINQSVFKFIRYYLHDKEARQQLYDRWTCLQSIRPDLSLIKKQVRAHKVPVRLLYGQFDRIIRHERGEKFRAGIESFCTLQIIPAGHQLLQEKHAEQIIQILQS